MTLCSCSSQPPCASCSDPMPLRASLHPPTPQTQPNTPAELCCALAKKQLSGVERLAHEWMGVCEGEQEGRFSSFTRKIKIDQTPLWLAGTMLGVEEGGSRRRGETVDKDVAQLLKTLLGPRRRWNPSLSFPPPKRTSSPVILLAIFHLPR